LEIGREFVIEPFRSHKREFRADKGKKHHYPMKRRSPILNSSLKFRETNLSLNANHGKVTIMKFKGTPSMREYWRDQKAKQKQRS
jgi:hypothetical protein